MASSIEYWSKKLNSPGSSDPDAAYTAIQGLAQSGDPRAVDVITKYVLGNHSDQNKTAALQAFLILHPREKADQILGLASSDAVLKTEYPEISLSPLIRSIGLMGDPTLVPRLKSLEAKLNPKIPASKDEAYFRDSVRLSFLVSYCRLNAPGAVEELTRALKQLKDSSVLSVVLEQEIQKLDPIQQAQVDLEFLDDSRKSHRIGGWREHAAPRTPEQKKSIEEHEKKAYVRVRDIAARGALIAFAGKIKNVKADPQREFLDSEISEIRAFLRGLSKKN